MAIESGPATPKAQTKKKKIVGLWRWSGTPQSPKIKKKKKIVAQQGWPTTLARPPPRAMGWPATLRYFKIFFYFFIVLVLFIF
jgi:hypothetical protein